MLAVAGTFLLLTTIEGQIVQPIAVGRRLAVSPLIVIIAPSFPGWLRGIAGRDREDSSRGTGKQSAWATKTVTPPTPPPSTAARA